VIVESLESRQLMSAGPVLSAVALHQAPLNTRRIVQHLTPARTASLVPPDFLTDYGGNYFVIDQTGPAALSITAHKGNTCSGIIAFYDNSGATITSGRLTVVFGRDTVFGNVKMTFKHRNTSLTGTGSYHAGDSAISFLLHGKFNGSRIPRFAPDEVAFIAGLNPVTTFDAERSMF
jgi:hypothetical protein